jgi:putative transposase
VIRPVVIMYVKYPLSLRNVDDLLFERWHLDEVYVKIVGEMHYLWRAVDHEGEVLESFVTRRGTRLQHRCSSRKR